MSKTEFAASKDGTRIAYEIAGKGPTLVVVAGALGYKDFPYLRAFVADFAKDFRVVIYDRRGRGGSGDTQPYSMGKEIDDLEAVIHAAEDPAIVLGTSSGAALALEAPARGVPMKALVAFEPPYMVGEHRRPNHVRYESDVSGYVARGDRAGAVSLFMRTVGIPRFFVGIMRLMPIWKKLKAVAHTLPYDASIMNDFDLPVSRFRAIHVPTLVVGGGKSPAALKDAVRAVGDAIPGAQVVEVPNQNHAIKGAALAPTVREFLTMTQPKGARATVSVHA